LFFRQPKTFLTVPQAINAGKWRVLYAPFIFLFVALRVGQILTRNQSSIVSVLSFMSILAIALIYWSIAVGRWRVWAFSNVSEMRWLYQRATVEHVLPSSNFFKKLEWKTDAQRAFWTEIEQQLQSGQTIKTTLEDYDLPAETRIFDSKWQFWWIPLVSFVILGGTYFAINRLLFPTEKNVEARAFFVMIPRMILLIAREWWRGVKMVFSTLEPQIILSNEGIETPEFGLKKWAEISKIDVDSDIGYGEDRRDELRFSCLTGVVTFTFFDQEKYEESIGNEFDEDDLEYDFDDIQDYRENIDEATYEAHKNDERYEKYEHTETFIKTLLEFTASPHKLEYLIKVYRTRADSERRINIVH
jgi:hypothetical protein